MRLVLLICAATAGCTDAITVQIASDRPVPSAIDHVCLGVADTKLGGGQFGQDYALTGELAKLPQTLRVEAGHAGSALAWVRGDRGGVAAARASAHVDFAHDVTLALDTCVKGPGRAPAQVGEAVGPAAAKLAASEGPGGTLVVAIGASGAVVIDAQHGALVATAAPPPPPGTPLAIVSADLDGDCDDDLVIVTDGAPPTVWIRDGQGFKDGGTIGSVIVAAVALGDVDRDGRTDVVLGYAGTLELWLNNGAATFTHATQALSGAGHVSSVSALALGDVDGDGSPDLVVGQAGAPLAAWLGGTGMLSFSTSIVPPVALAVESLAFGDADGDYDPDLAVAVTGAAMRLYIDRDGHLEDQSFVRLPQPAPVAHAIAFGGWDDGCEPDAVVAADAGAATLRGQPTGVFAAAEPAPPASDVVMTDIDDDGDLDAVLATDQGVVWLAR
ncbi:MAG: VCBS repeat-containing protein [Kofleriaceae bacterium]